MIDDRKSAKRYSRCNRVLGMHSSRCISIRHVVTRRRICGTRVHVMYNQATGLSIRTVLTRSIVFGELHSADTVSCRCRCSCSETIAGYIKRITSCTCSWNAAGIVGPWLKTSHDWWISMDDAKNIYYSSTSASISLCLSFDHFQV